MKPKPGMLLKCIKTSNDQQVLLGNIYIIDKVYRSGVVSIKGLHGVWTPPVYSASLFKFDLTQFSALEKLVYEI